MSMLMPLPGVANHGGELWVLRLPAEFALGFLGAGHQHRWISGTPGCHVGQQPPFGGVLDCFNYLLYGIAFAVAEVVDVIPPLARPQQLHAQHMGIG